MATTGLINALIRLLTSANVVDVEIPLAFTQVFANGQLFQQGVINTVPVAITLPCVNILFVYIKSMSGTIAIDWQPAVGVLSNVQNLSAGGIILMNNPSPGITALTIGVGTYDLLIGG